MAKPLDPLNLLQDLIYVVRGTFVHEWLFQVCPPRRGLRVLEPGCGSGKFATAYGLRDATAWAFDLDPTCVTYATRLKDTLQTLVGRHLQVRVEQGDLFSKSVTPGSFDLVLNEGVPQHWQDERRQGCLERMAAWTRPGGIVAVMGNNGLNPQERETDRTFEFGFMGMPPQRKCFTPEELQERMSQSGLTDIQVEPLGGDWQHAVLLGAWGRKEHHEGHIQPWAELQRP